MPHSHTASAERTNSATGAVEERMRSSLVPQAEMHCRFRSDGTIVFANAAYAEARGTTARALAGANFWQFIPAQEQEAVRAMLDGLSPAHPQVRIENTFLTGAGERWMLWTNRALSFDAQGRWLEAQSTAIDITERKRAEQALARSAARLEALYRLTDRLQRIERIETLYEAALDAIEQALLCQRASILLFDDGGVMRFVAWRGLSEAYRRAVEGHSPWAPGEADPQAFGLDDIEQAELSAPLADTIRAESIRALAFVPLLADGRLVGKFMVYYDAPHAFPTEELETAATIARQVAFGLQRLKAEALRRSAEEKVRRSEQELSELFETAAVGLHSVGPDGRLLRMNQTELELLGYRREELLGQPIRGHFVEPRQFDEMFARLQRGEMIRDHPAQLRCKDGSVRHVLIHSSAVFENEALACTRSFVLDITARKRSEQALAESEHRFRMVADSMPAMISYVDRQHRYLYLNARYGDWFGVEPEQLIGIHMRDLLGEAMYRTRLPYIERVLHGESVRFERSGPHARFGERSTEIVYVPHTGLDGFVDGFYVMGFDVTDRKRTEQMLRIRVRQQHAVAALGKLALRESDLQKVFEHATRSVAETLEIEYCKILEALPGGAELLLRAGFGWKPGLVGSLKISTGIESQAGYALLCDAPIVVTDLRTEQRFRDHQLLSEHDVVSGMSCQITGVNGLPWGVIGAHASRPIKFSEDDVTFLATVANTLSDAILRQRAEQALRENDRRKDEFLAMLSHELRNPLAPIKNSLQVLRLVGTSAEAGPVHEIMERQVNHLVRLVDDLLEVSRISRGTFELRRGRVDLQSIVRNAVETSGPLMQQSRHRLEVDVPQKPLLLDGDPVRLAQILSNLLNNAAKYTPPGGLIQLQAHEEKGEVVISVRDNGIGIRREALAGIFEMFSRGDQTDEPSGSSLGIGLSLARRLAQMHGGGVEARSEGEGKGAEFVVRLPLGSVQKQVVEMLPSLQSELVGRRILVVDDNRDSADSLGMLLQAQGAEAHVVHDGPAALAAYSGFRPHVVLLDIGMPGMDGYEVARRLRKSPLGESLLLVAISGWGQEEDRRRARVAGFDHHLTKPADLAELHALVRAADPMLATRAAPSIPAPAASADPADQRSRA